MESIVELKGISKAFSGVPVLEKANLAIKPGSVHALIGGNGAGKSTLMKVLSGLFQPDEGEIWVGGKRVCFRNPNDAHNHGIYLVPQDPMLYPSMTIKENIMLSIPKKENFNQDKITQVMESLNCDFRLGQLAGDVTIAKQQQIELIRGLIRETKIVILDEPTSALTAKETEALFDNIRKLKAEKSLAIIYITHRLNELFEIADEVTVLKDKKVIASNPISMYTLDDIIKIMVPQIKRGDADRTEYSKSVSENDAANILTVDSYSGPGFSEASFSLRKNEILGLTGVVGAGRTEFAETLFGLKKKYSGSLKLMGETVEIKNPKDAIKKGLVYVPENRHLHGGFLEASIKNNITSSILFKLTKIFLKHQNEMDIYDRYVKCFSIKVASPDQNLQHLSGGNQQKVVLGKWLATKPKVIVFDEPTRGIDAGAREDIYRIIKDLAAQGMGVIVISSDFEEITLLCNRVVVMYSGKTASEISRSNMNLENITYAAFGYAKEV